MDSAIEIEPTPEQIAEADFPIGMTDEEVAEFVGKAIDAAAIRTMRIVGLFDHMKRATCTECGRQFLHEPDRTPLWGMCHECHEKPRTVAVNVGPQPHLMSEGEYAMHMRNKRDIEKRVRAGEGIEFKEKGPLEFRPKP